MVNRLLLAAALSLLPAAAAFAQPYQGQGDYQQPYEHYPGPPQAQYGPPPQEGGYGPPRDGYDQGPQGGAGYGPPPGQYGPPPSDWQGGSRHWERHVRRCFAHHDNYDPRSNTYTNSRGQQRSCH